MTAPWPSSNDRPRQSGRRGLAHPWSSRGLLWAVLALPALWLLTRWAGGASTYGEVVSRTGAWSALLLVPATLVTPLGLLFPQAPWLAWLVRHRHDLGVACVGYACAHAMAYAIGKGSLGLVLREARHPWLLAGWVALLVFVAFAAIRRGTARRDPRPSWTRRHRIIHAGGVLVILHWAFSAFDPLTIQVQTALRDYGYYGGPIDGIIGPQSREALAWLQRDHGLAVTGGITQEVLDLVGIIPN